MKFQAKLILFFSVLLLVFLTIGFIGYRSETKALEGQIREKLEGQAYHTLDKIDRMLFERYADMKVLSSDPVLVSRSSTPEKITERLKEYQNNYKAYASLSFFDLKRVRTADTSGWNIGKQHPFTEYWPGIAEGREFVLIITMSESLKKAVLYFASVVKDKDGKPFGVVVARMPVDTLYEIAEQTIRPGNGRQQHRVELLDNKGMVLYSSYNAPGVSKEESDDWKVIGAQLASGARLGSARHFYKEGEEITAFARERGHRGFSGNDWILTICTPCELAFAGTTEKRNRFVIVFSLIGLFGLIGTIMFSHSITRPLKELASAAGEIGKGNLDINLTARSKDEAGELVRVFNAMALDLRESEKKYKDFAEFLPQFVFELDAKGNILFLNRYALESLGYTQEDLNKGLRALQMFAPEELDRVGKNILRVLNGEVLDGIEYTGRKKDGKTFPALVFASPIIHENTITGLRGIAIDISELKQAEDNIKKAEQEWERTFDSITAPIMILDINHRIVKANKAMADKMGVSPAAAIGLACYKSVHDKNEPPAFCPHVELLTDGKPHTTEIFEERLGGYFMISVSPLFSPDGTLYGSVHYASDITGRKQAEEAVRKLNEELELKVGERTRQLLDVQEELVGKERLFILGQLAGSVGHELRNPLGVMSNAVYYLKTVLSGADETVNEYLNIIKGEINNSQRIITDLLDFSKTKTPQPGSIRVDELMEESFGKCVIPENIMVRVDIPEMLPLLRVDRFQMLQVFQNLITNAVQEMPDGGELRIGARQARRDRESGTGKDEPATFFESRVPNPEFRVPDYIEISVADTGKGISPENMKKLFQPLFTTKARGIGLGLTVSKNLTEANCGRIVVESELEKGTTFTVILPVSGDMIQTEEQEQ